MTDSVHISVIIPVLNSAKYLRPVMEALLACDYPEPEYEILFADNGSGDDSVELIRAYPRIRLFSEPKPGSYCARNRAVREARGRILAFTDSDCVVDRGWLRAIVDGLDDPHVKILLGRVRPAVERGVAKRLGDYDNEKAAYITRLGTSRQQYGFTNNLAMRRTTWEEHGPFREALRGSDTVFVRKVADHSLPGAVRYCPAMAVRHLELTDLGAYCRKMFLYGRSFTGYSRIAAAEPLGLEDRLRVFATAAANERYAITGAAVLGSALVCGYGAWSAGRLMGSDISDSAPAEEVSEPPKPANPQAPNSTVTVVIEWENVLLSEMDRAHSMMRELATQIGEVVDRGLRSPVEVVVAYGRDNASARDLEPMLKESFLTVGDRVRLQLVACDEDDYYELKNAGARAAQGDVLVFLDCDTIPESGWLASLLAPMSDASSPCVCGASYIEPHGILAKAFASWWFFPPRTRSAGFEPAKVIFANNFAVRRELFLEDGFRPIPGTSRGACVAWRERMLKRGVPVLRALGARVGHPPTNGLRHFVIRALTHGRDFILLARYQGRTVEAGLFGTGARWALNVLRSTINSFARRRSLGVRWWELPVVLAIAWSYYGILLGGEIMTHLAPEWMIRKFRV